MSIQASETIKQERDAEPRVLIVDDDADIQSSLKDVLEVTGGYEVKTASDLLSARYLLSDFRPEVALLDIKLLDNSGLELISLVRDYVPDARCIMMTAYRDVEYAMKAIRKGADEYLLKPLDPAHLLETIEDNIRALQLHREESRRRENRDLVLGQINQLLFLLDEGGQVLEVSQAALEFLGVDRRDILGRRLWELPWSTISADDMRLLKSSARTAADGGDVGFDLSLASAGGRNACFEFRIRHVAGSNIAWPRILVEASDITARKQTETQLRQLAHYDPLTGLPNRTLFAEHLSSAIAVAGRFHRQLAVMFIDLDNFKLVNDTAGHGVGDDLLMNAATVLWECLREDDVIARFGGDEFAVILREVPDLRVVDMVASRIMRQLTSLQAADNAKLHVSASIGISVFPADGDDSAALIDNADKAMYRAKQKGKNQYCLYRD